MLGNEPPHSQVSSKESNFRGQNPLDQQFPYIIGKFLERRCLKWAYMTYLGN
jgi:hypothetical protein